MATEAQINANKKNAQKSTGPKTPEGRDAVRLNGLKHGLTSEILVLPGESVADFEHLLDSLEAEHQHDRPYNGSWASARTRHCVSLVSSR